MGEGGEGGGGGEGGEGGGGGGGGGEEEGRREGGEEGRRRRRKRRRKRMRKKRRRKNGRSRGAFNNYMHQNLFNSRLLSIVAVLLQCLTCNLLYYGLSVYQYGRPLPIHHLVSL